jgi:hypothetical protein
VQPASVDLSGQEADGTILVRYDVNSDHKGDGRPKPWKTVSNTVWN